MGVKYIDLSDETLEVMRRIYNPLRSKAHRVLTRYVVAYSKSPEIAFIVKCKGEEQFIEVFKKYRLSGYMGLCIGLFRGSGDNILSVYGYDRVFFDCECKATAKIVYDVLVNNFNIVPLIIDTGGRGYHLIVFITNMYSRSPNTVYIVYKLFTTAFEELAKRKVYRLDMFIGSQLVTYHVVPYTYRERYRRFSCICNEEFECVEPKEALSLIDKAIRKGVSYTFRLSL